MISISFLFEQDKSVEKIAITKNYVVEDYKNPPKEEISKYRRKEIIDKTGQRHLATFAILNKLGQKAKGVKTVMTSMWHPKTEDKAQKIAVKNISKEKEM